MENNFKDKYLVTVAGEVIGWRSDFKGALKLAQEISTDSGQYASIEIQEQRLIAGVYPNGHVVGRKE